MTDSAATITRERQEKSRQIYERRQVVNNPLVGCKKEIVLDIDIEVARERVREQFMQQPWVQAILDQRQYDNENHVPITPRGALRRDQGRTYEVTPGRVNQLNWPRRDQGRTYEVTQGHVDQLNRQGITDTRLWGYNLIIVPDDKYMSDHFEDGKRVPYLSDRNLYLLDKLHIVSPRRK